MPISNFLPTSQRLYPNLKLSITRTHLSRRQDQELTTMNCWMLRKVSIWVRPKITMRWSLKVMDHLLQKVKSEPPSKTTLKDPLTNENLSGQKAALISMLHLSQSQQIKPQGSRHKISTFQKVPSLQHLVATKVSIWILKLAPSLKQTDLSSPYSRPTQLWISHLGRPMVVVLLVTINIITHITGETWHLWETHCKVMKL